MSLCKTSDGVVDTDEVLVRTRPYRILLAVTGSVATIKLQEVIDALIRGESRTANNTYSEPQYREVRVIMTESSKHFFNVPFDMENSGAKKDGGIDSIRMTDQQRFIYRLDSASLNRQLRNRDPRGKDQETATNDKSKVLVGNPNPQATVVLHINSTTPPAEIFFYDDECEYNAWQCKGDSVLHIDLKDWADVLVVAPMSANTLAKIANGTCDNLLTCVLRAWPCRGSWKEPTPSPEDAWQSPTLSPNVSTMPQTATSQFLYKPIVIAPAMNTNMLYHPATRAHMTTLNTWYNNTQINPTNMAAEKGDENLKCQTSSEQQLFLAGTVQKLLACGVQGDGAMASPLHIANLVETALSYVYCRFTRESNVRMSLTVEQDNVQAFSRYIYVK